ncbi:MAG TPA: type IV toxin-antitoxin system AbiEi family antitoxin domain-containing protein [Candidatus Obscuribacterales bacterium]
MYPKRVEPGFDELYSLAQSQQGFFSASQARRLGYSRQLQAYHVKEGHWLRKGRGIFRLKYFPRLTHQEDFVVVYLWALNRDGEPEGVLSHGTALYLHNLSTYVPPVTDLTVPKHFRRHSDPPGRMVLHKRTLARSDWERVHGLPVTTPLKTIIDLLDTRLIDYDYVLDGLKTALDRFLITPKHMKEAGLSREQKERLVTALARVNYAMSDEIR